STPGVLRALGRRGARKGVGIRVWTAGNRGRHCKRWIRHLEDHGFIVEEAAPVDPESLKSEMGIPPSLWNCHTAVIDGYVIEGHVPAVDIIRLLEERPFVSGLAVAGQPAGAPGVVNGDPGPYEVLAFTRQGEISVFARHG
nr:hypothetical protein [Gemmatimonadota bacterium]NIR80434.1 hypothetical protein [Gemmatimonadota bacterium]NIT89194.1 hypothetical protein [Gemmatimonadota bacterium]NIU32994.1 hypothetical protein [Gemmatimonadota bacterium]NIU37378.1 hypothetical protein [Gemmatimonadota bacterium]